ncbi:MAG: o-succinylbenzoate synthase [Mariniphaga sp.]|nr:o-succinylbenzoate synthase [Mariniphaga sp.]MDD4224944.1 o-succinylbenzoate synthase [Mariniphaga sp.]
MLNFKLPAKTSRGEYGDRTVWFLFLEEDGVTGVGECAPLPGLSLETAEEVEFLLHELCRDPEKFISQPELTCPVSSVHLALEMAWLDLQNGGRQQLFPSEFCRGEAGIPINGLVWMGDSDSMQKQTTEKIAAGYRCIKFKVGGIHFSQELEILKSVRSNYNSGEIMLRIDANGAFKPEEVMDKLHQLAPLDIHSIEQPVAAGQWQNLARICRESPIPVALDEELIGIYASREKEQLLDTIQPHYLVLKPSLHGGFSGCNEWIELAGKRAVSWWITSYLESNIGLNAIAQWTFSKNRCDFQGLGTGSLYTNNILSPLSIRNGELYSNPAHSFLFPENFNGW